MDSKGTADPNPVTTTTAAPGAEAKFVEARPAKTRDDCLRELGYALIYMRWMRPWWRESKEGEDQYRRVKLLCKEMAVEWRRGEDDTWWSYFCEKIREEIDNLC